MCGRNRRQNVPNLTGVPANVKWGHISLPRLCIGLGDQGGGILPETPVGLLP